VWVIRGNADTTAADPVDHKYPYWNNFTSEVDNTKRVVSKNPVTKAKMQLNGNDRFAERDGTY